MRRWHSGSESTSVSSGWPAGTVSPGLAARATTTPSTGAATSISASSVWRNSSLGCPLTVVPTPQDALKMGYAAFDHHTRQGARTVSWYRGPLLPYENPRLARVPFSSADSLVRYDPESGMIDVSFAAAWQLGRLLALGDQAFASLLYDWKEGRRTQAVVDFERRFLGDQLGLGASALELDPRAHVALMQAFVKPLLDALVGEGG